VRSSVTRRIKVALSAAVDGLSCSRSSRARTNESMGLRTHSSAAVPSAIAWSLRGAAIPFGVSNTGQPKPRTRIARRHHLLSEFFVEQCIEYSSGTAARVTLGNHFSLEGMNAGRWVHDATLRCSHVTTLTPMLQFAPTGSGLRISNLPATGNRH